MSMVMDHYSNDWSKRIPNTINLPYIQPGQLMPEAPPLTAYEIEQFRKLLESAKQYDIKNNEPDCEMESKKEALKAIAEKLGVKIDFL